MGVALHEPLQDLGWLEDVCLPGHLLEGVGLVRVEVARVLVDVDAGAQALHVEVAIAAKVVGRGFAGGRAKIC